MTVRTEDRESYRVAVNWLSGALHELPAGVLWGPNGATAADCQEMLDGLEEYAHLCARLRLDDDQHREFIEQCRWHFEHYPSYLGRRRHFANYEQYVTERHGPLRVANPVRPW